MITTIFAVTANEKTVQTMTDRERLIELVKASVYGNIDEGFYGPELNCENVTDYLLANGVIVPPCKVGDIVYPLNADSRFRAFVEKVEITADGLCFGWVQYDVGVDCTECWDEDLFTIDDIGKTVFLDETEYLVALKEREQNDR